MLSKVKLLQCILIKVVEYTLNLKLCKMVLHRIRLVLLLRSLIYMSMSIYKRAIKFELLNVFKRERYSFSALKMDLR